ncbi:hypothetical protein OIDMADRAFT_169633 [Oidiodendron maius Zn]|uniref:Cyclochlorotine biosynthesis protein O n=1 Tax=Oidiodendron maius (strain Zn) TaxID=913774 RepID=A0A0C3H2T2_OIDMZ|nr:hypothetical protein OIDMADRAFT_169633 [Oidiodendron maius Zn]
MAVKDSELESFLPSQISSPVSRRKRILHKFALLGWILNIIQFAIICYGWIYPRKPTDLECTRQLNAWSPVFDVVEYEDVQFSNAFFQPSPYKGPPTPELEKAWSDLWKIGTIDVPYELLPALNKSDDGNWLRSDKGGILAGLEVFHSMHCLDMVRQYTYKDEYDYSDNPTFQDDADFLRSHVDHCIEALRIRLMCYSDITPFLHRIEPGAELGATPDFDTQHKCKKYDKIQEWQRNNHARAAKGQGAEAGHGHSHNPSR